MRRMTCAAVVLALLLLVGGCAASGALPTPPTQSVTREVCEQLRGIPYRTGPVLGFVYDGTADAFRFSDLPPGLLVEMERLVEEGRSASTAPDAPVPVVKVFSVGSDSPGPDIVFPLDFAASGTDVRRGQVRVARQCLVQRIDALRPTVEGSPILRRIADAVAAEPDMVTVHVSTPGTSNVTPLDINALSPGATPDQIAEGLRTAGHLPVLNGVPVTFHHLGVTTDGRLPEPGVRWLTALWLGICRASGGVCHASTRIGEASNSPVTDLPADAAVAVPQQANPALCDVSQGIAGTALFHPDSSELLPGAEELLGSAVDALKESPELSAVITGHAAMAPDSTEAGRLQISQDRAARVLDALVSAGVERTRLTARGVGATERLVEDVAPNGRFLEAEAARNRRVVIDYTCPDTQP